MKTYTKVTRKTVGEDRIAICPKFGCESLTRVKPLKFSFLGFGKYPKCKKHHIPLVYIDERIGDFVDATLACLFDKAGLPSNELFRIVSTKFPDELDNFVKGWIYCITIGRGAPIASQYMDSISNTYLKHLTKKQIKNFEREPQSKSNNIYQAIRNGINEITIQYTRFLTHLRAHSEVINDPNHIKPLSINLRDSLLAWLKITLNENAILQSRGYNPETSLVETKNNYDQILNVGICRCLLGLSPENRVIKKSGLTAFDRFSSYYDFYIEDLTEKFTKYDIDKLLQTPHNNEKISNNFKKLQISEFLKNKYENLLDPNLLNAFREYTKYFKNLGEKKSPNFGTRYITKDFKHWLEQNEDSQELLKICNSITKNNDLINLIIDIIQTTNLNLAQIVEVMNSLGLSFNSQTINNAALKYLYDGNKKLFSNRFPIGLHRSDIVELTDNLSTDYNITRSNNPLITKYDNKFTISTNFLKLISEIIYSIFLKFDLTKKQKLFTEYSEIEENVKNHFKINKILNYNINNIGFEQFLDDTIKDFTVIISSLKIYNDISKGELFKIKPFANELIQRNYNLKLALPTLRSKILPEIINHLNYEFIDFTLNPLRKRKLEQDKTGKVCGGCGIKKKWSEFQKLSEGGVQSKCKKCTGKFIEILKYKKKLRLLFELQNSKFEGKCSNCSTDFKLLPTFDFHHPSKKNHSWTIINKRKYESIKELLEEDCVIPICKNCHALEQQKILSDYKNLILNQHLFIKKSGNKISTVELNDMIDQAILSHPYLKEKIKKDTQYIGHVKYMIKSWIRKRAIVEQLYGGECINCGNNNLSALTFHHLTPNVKKEISSEAFRKFSIKQLANKIVQEECICLCANCHAMTEATIFEEHSEEVFKDMVETDVYIKFLNNFYDELSKNIQKEHKRILDLKSSHIILVIDYLEKKSD